MVTKMQPRSQRRKANSALKLKPGQLDAGRAKVKASKRSLTGEVKPTYDLADELKKPIRVVVKKDEVPKAAAKPAPAPAAKQVEFGDVTIKRAPVGGKEVAAAKRAGKMVDTTAGEREVKKIAKRAEDKVEAIDWLNKIEGLGNKQIIQVGGKSTKVESVAQSIVALLGDLHREIYKDLPYVMQYKLLKEYKGLNLAVIKELEFNTFRASACGSLFLSQFMMRDGIKPKALLKQFVSIKTYLKEFQHVILQLLMVDGKVSIKLSQNEKARAKELKYITRLQPVLQHQRRVVEKSLFNVDLIVAWLEMLDE